VGVDHGRGQILVPKQVLNGANVGAALKQAGGGGMTKGMGADGLRQTGTVDRHHDGLVDDTGVNMMATGDAGTRVYGDMPGGEDIRPAPGVAAMRRLASQRMGQVDLAMPLRQVLLRPRLDPGQVVLEQRRQKWQERW
jgi:hypothetical protein